MKKKVTVEDVLRFVKKLQAQSRKIEKMVGLSEFGRGCYHTEIDIEKFIEEGK